MPTKTYTMVRDCCTSGNCFVCSNLSPFGAPVRVIHATGLSKENAQRNLAGWKNYHPELREEES